MRLFTLLVLTLYVGVSIPALGDTLFVKPADQAKPDGDGSSWDMAFAGLDKALDHVRSQREKKNGASFELRLLGSTSPYFIPLVNEQNRKVLPGGAAGTAAFSLPTDITISGSYDGKSPDSKTASLSTMLSGQRNRETTWQEQENWYNVIAISEAGRYIIEDVVISNGIAASTPAGKTEASAEAADEPSWSGAGICIQNANARVICRRLVITNNTARKHGGGVFNKGQLLLVNCTVAGNSCGYRTQTLGSFGSGGGVHDFENGRTTYINSIIARNHCYAAAPLKDFSGIGPHDIHQLPKLDDNDLTFNSLFGTVPKEADVDTLRNPVHRDRMLLFPIDAQVIEPGFLKYPQDANGAVYPGPTRGLPEPFQYKNLGVTRSGLAALRARPSNYYSLKRDVEPPVLKPLAESVLPTAVLAVQIDNALYGQTLDGNQAFKLPASAYILSAEKPSSSKLMLVGADGQLTEWIAPNPQTHLKNWHQDWQDVAYPPVTYRYANPIATTANLGAFMKANGPGSPCRVKTEGNQVQAKFGSELKYADFKNLTDVFDKVRSLNNDDDISNDVFGVWLQNGLYTLDRTIQAPANTQIVGGFAGEENADQARGQAPIIEGKDGIPLFYVENAIGVHFFDLILRSGDMPVDFASGRGATYEEQKKVVAATTPEAVNQAKAEVATAVLRQSGGGALRVFSSGHGLYSDARLQQIAIFHCKGANGGAIWSNSKLSLHSCTVMDNQASLQGGGVCIEPSADKLTPKVDCTLSVIARNQVLNTGGNKSPEARHNLFGGQLSGAWNLILEPTQASFDALNRLQIPEQQSPYLLRKTDSLPVLPRNSLLVDATNYEYSALSNPRDILGKPRVQGRSRDIGAFEYPFKEYPMPCELNEKISTENASYRLETAVSDLVHSIQNASERNSDDVPTNDVVAIVIKSPVDESTELQLPESPLVLPPFVGIFGDPVRPLTLKIRPSTDDAKITGTLFKVSSSQGVMIKDLAFEYLGNKARATCIRIESDPQWPASLFAVNSQWSKWNRRAFEVSDVKENLDSYRSTLVLLDSEVCQNEFSPSLSSPGDESEPGGGALLLNNSQAFMSRSIFEKNVFKQGTNPKVIPQGGAVLSANSNLWCNDCAFTDNRIVKEGTYPGESPALTSQGGAIASPSSKLTLGNSIIVYNSADKGSGIAHSGPNISLDGCIISRNQAFVSQLLAVSPIGRDKFSNSTVESIDGEPQAPEAPLLNLVALEAMVSPPNYYGGKARGMKRLWGSSYSYKKASMVSPQAFLPVTIMDSLKIASPDEPMVVPFIEIRTTNAKLGAKVEILFGDQVIASTYADQQGTAIFRQVRLTDDLSFSIHVEGSLLGAYKYNKQSEKAELVPVAPPSLKEVP